VELFCDIFYGADPALSAIVTLFDGVYFDTRVDQIVWGIFGCKVVGK